VSEPRPLAGKRVLLVRAEGQTDGPAQLLRERGAEPVVIPTIAVGPPDDEDVLRETLRALANFDWVVFTSANGVDFTWRALEAEGQTTAAFASARFAVVGSATRQALEAHGIAADVVAKEFHGEGLAAAMLANLGLSPPVSRLRVLILRAQEANDVLPEALISAGADVAVAAVYRTRSLPEGAAEVRRRLSEQSLDVVVLSSGSTVDSICDALGPGLRAAFERVTVVCLGPVTARAAAARGVRVDVVPRVATFTAAIEALEEHFRAI